MPATSLDTIVSLCKRRGIVYSIAGHGNQHAPGLHLFHFRSFVLRQDFGEVFIQSDLI